MAEQKAIWVYGAPEGWKPPTKKEFHGERWFEIEVPYKIEKKISRIVQKELNAFYRKCKCEDCVENRKRKK